MRFEKLTAQANALRDHLSLSLSMLTAEIARQLGMERRRELSVIRVQVRTPRTRRKIRR